MIDSLPVDLSPLERAEIFTPLILQGEELDMVLNGHWLQGNPYVINPIEALSLTEVDAFAISDTLKRRLLGTTIGSGLKTGKWLWNIEHHQNNVILHEKAHLQKIYELRPKLIEETSIRIFFHTMPELEGEIGSQGAVFVPLSLDQPYSALERVEINLAPMIPSRDDYLQIRDILRVVPFEIEEISEILKILKRKPKGSIRNYVIKYLDDPQWAKTVTQNDLDKWAKEDLDQYLRNYKS